MSEYGRIAKEASQLLRELRLFESTTDPPKLNERLLEEFAQRKKSFDWVHMGTVNLPMQDLWNVFGTAPFISAPRTAHLGNWPEIALGRSGALDFNAAICAESRLGHPLIFDLTKSEDEAIQNGDTVYLPGSIIEREKRTVLKLFTWDGTTFKERPRDVCWFSPFALTLVNDEMVPLSRLHREKGSRFAEYEIRYYSFLIRQNEPRVREILRCLLEDAHHSPEPERALKLVFDRYVSADGAVSRTSIKPHGKGYLLESARFDSAEDLIDAAMLPVLAADDPDMFFSQLHDLPPVMPLMASTTNGMLQAVLYSHYPGAAIDSRTTFPCNVHLHWGADEMAGYPPKKHGNFSSSVKKSRRLYQALVQRFADVPPVLYVLLPASIFTLCPSSALPRDHELLDELFRKTLNAAAECGNEPAKTIASVDALVLKWWEENSRHLSPYFVSGFTKQRSVGSAEGAPEEGSPVKLPSFKRLTIRQASILVGAVHQAVATRVVG